MDRNGAASDFSFMRLHVLSAFLALGAALGCSSEKPSSSGAAAAQADNGASQAGSRNAAGAGAVGGAGAPKPGGATALGGAAEAGGGATGVGASSGSGGVSAGGSGPAASTLSGCALEFPYQDEPERGTWLGGDSAYSTLLSPSVALWSFQDTFVGKHGQTTRDGAGLIANSFA